MRYQIEQLPKAVVFRPLEERLNATHTATLKAEFAVLAHSHTGPVIVDLATIQHIDSSVLSALLLLRRILGEQARDLLLVAPTPAVQSVFSLSKLNEIFTLMPTIEDALLHLQNQTALLAKKKAEEEDPEAEEWEEEDLEWEEEEGEEWEEEDWEDEEDWEEEDWEEVEEDWEEEDWEEGEEEEEEEEEEE